MSAQLRLAPKNRPDQVFEIVSYTPKGARLAQYNSDGYIVQFSMLCDNVYEGLEWIRENVQAKGIAIFGKELRK